MTDKYFTKAKAETLKGTRVQTMVEFSGVPKDTTGTVTGADKTGRDTAGPDGYTVAIQWDLPQRGKPLVDWFDKTEFEKYLQTL